MIYGVSSSSDTAVAANPADLQGEHTATGTTMTADFGRTTSTSSPSSISLLSLIPRKVSVGKSEMSKEKPETRRKKVAADRGSSSSAPSIPGNSFKTKRPPGREDLTSKEGKEVTSVGTRILQWFFSHNKPVTPQFLTNELGSQFSKAVIQKNLEALYQEKKYLCVKDFKKIRVYYLSPTIVMEETKPSEEEKEPEKGESRGIVAAVEGRDAASVPLPPHNGEEKSDETHCQRGDEEKNSICNGIDVVKDGEGGPLASSASVEAISMTKTGELEPENEEVVKVLMLEREKKNEREEGEHHHHYDEVAVHSAEKKKREREESEVFYPLDPHVKRTSTGRQEKDSQLGEHEKEERLDPHRTPSGTVGTPTGTVSEVPLVESNRERGVEMLVSLHREKEEQETQLHTWKHDSPRRCTTLAASIQLQHTCQQEEKRVQTLKREDGTNREIQTKLEGEKEKTSESLLPFPPQCLQQKNTLADESDREKEEEDDDAVKNPTLFAALVSKYREARKRWADRKEYVQRLVDQMRSETGAVLSLSSNTLYHLYGVVSDEVAGVSWKESAVDWKL